MAIVAELVQQPAAGRLPHPGLELEPLQLGDLAGEQMLGRTHGISDTPSWSELNVPVFGQRDKYTA